jgi:hypothetical protein
MTPGAPRAARMSMAAMRPLLMVLPTITACATLATGTSAE